MARLIGTAGHVDHGKTTLIQALTGIDADRLPEEKARGMTIDVGFAYIDLPIHGRVSIVDVPGHERFIHNMLVGALGIDVALLCVAADEGVKPQTREHFEILKLLPVEHMVIALTRADLADSDTRELATLDVVDLVGESRFKDAQVVSVSAVTGEGIDALREALSEALSRAHVKKGGPWYLPVDRVFAVKGHGTVATGTLAQGAVRVGDRAYLEPGHLEVRVRAIHSHSEQLEKGEAGKRTALNLGGIRMEDVHRGMAVGEPGALFETRCFDGRMEWIVPPKHGQRVRISIGADEVLGKVFLNDHDESLVQLRLEQPVAAALNQPFILRRHSPMEVLGGGKVLVPLGVPRRKSEAPTLIQADDDVTAILQAVGGSPNGLMTEEICRLMGKTPQSLGSVFEDLGAEGRLLGFAGRWITPSGFEVGVTKVREALKELHHSHPRQAMHPRERVMSMAGLAWAGKPLDRILSRLAEAKVLVVEGTTIRDAEFSLQLTDKQRNFLDRVKQGLDAAGVNVPFPSDLAHALSVPPQAVDEILKLGVEARELIRVDEGIFYTNHQLEQIREMIRALAAPFSAADFRDSVGSSRKYVIPLLEHFDSVGFTLRQGDKRVVR
jgi:selenocysteine-specific elongation factor